MNRLTFKEPSGNWGVVGMDNPVYELEEKIYRCLDKLLDYEELGLNPDDVVRLMDKLEDMEENLQTLEKEMNLLKESQKVRVGTIIQGYRIIGILKTHCIAERINKVGCDDFVVWRIDFDGKGVCSGKYFEFYEFAKAYFMEMTF